MNCCIQFERNRKRTFITILTLVMLLLSGAKGDDAFTTSFSNRIEFFPSLSSSGYSSKEPYIENNLLLVHQIVEGPAFVSHTPENEFLLSLINGTGDGQISFTFIPEENYTIQDYELAPLIENSNIISNEDEDVTILIVEDRSENFLSYNVTLEMDFNKWTGTTNISLLALNATNENEEASSDFVKLVIVGITFYSVQNDQSLVIFGGQERSLNITTNETDLSSDYNLNVFIQNYNGSSSNDSILVSLSDITISTSGLNGQINYNSSCQPVSGTYNGSDVILPTNCGLGFSDNLLNGSYVGPYFGMDIQKYYNESFILRFEWNEIVQGSDLEDDGYETILNVILKGEVPPVVTGIYPSGPFSSSGTDQATINVRNLPDTIMETKEWQYDLSIAFENGNSSGTLIEESFVSFENRTTSMNFRLPPGVGENLSWNLQLTRSDGVVVDAIDNTDPPYLFSFQMEIFIDSINPDSGPDTGGTQVTLFGLFPAVDPSQISILFNGVEIDSSLITNIDESSISFTTPPRASVGAELETAVVVSINGINSNSVMFLYEPSLQIDNINPSFGPESGGTEITLTGQFDKFNPTAGNSAIIFDETRLSESAIVSFSDANITFILPARSTVGDKEIYVFNVTVQADGSVSNEVVFSYAVPSTIESISPSSGDINGGTLVTITGQFTNFTSINSSIVIGGVSINSENIASTNSTIIEFNTPPLIQVGTSRRQLIWVVTGGIDSNKVIFNYVDETPRVQIFGDGGEFDSSTGEYYIGRCSNSTFRAVTSSLSVENATYIWTFESTDGETILSEDTGDRSDILLIPYNSIPETNQPYNLTIRVISGSTSLFNSLSVTQRSVRRIGVSIPPIRPRSPSEPNVTLTIPAFIIFPDCVEDDISTNSTEMTFVWNYEDQDYVYSYLNESSPSNEIGPTLLGREFQIPQQFMKYGNFRISLIVFLTEEPSIQGSGSSIVSIEPAPLFSQINGGQLSQIVAVSQPVVMSAGKSRDPDIIDGNQTESLLFSWKCRYGLNELFNETTTCSENLLPTTDTTDLRDFTLTREALESIRNSSQNVYIQYFLQVLKTSTNATGSEIERSSDIVETVLVLVPSEDELYESLDNVLIVNNQSVPIDILNVKYYENVLISPVSGTSETTWRIELLSPQSEAQKLLATDDNLLPYPGYFRVGSDEGRYVLGLKANVLSPSTEYKFLISTFRSGYAVNEQVISITTVDQPIVTIGGQLFTSGSTNDTFLLTGSANYDGDFKFFFFLTDEFGFENCVGGCQGTSFVIFRILSPGTYQLRCDLYDSLGYTLLASAQGEEVTITSRLSSDGDLSLFEAEFNDAFLAGDHASYQQIGLDMVKYIVMNEGSNSPDFDSDILSNFSIGLNQISGNSVPNSIQSLSYVRTAAAIANLTPDLGITFNTESLYALINITRNAIERTPDSAALQQLEDLIDFYNLAPELLTNTFSTGTSRRRLLQELVEEDEVYPIFLDLYEMMKEQLQLCVLKRCTCGCEEEVTTGIRSQNRNSLRLRTSIRQEDELTTAASYTNPLQSALSQVHIKMAHYCNSEQGTNLIVKQGENDEAEFVWCKEVFRDSIVRLYFAIATTPNFLTIANLHTNTTLTDGLISTSISTINNNSIEETASEIDNCFILRLPIKNELVEFPNDADTDQIPAGLQFAPPKKWDNETIDGLYIPSFGEISTIIADEPRKADSPYTDVSLVHSSPGLMTVATRFAWSGALLSLEGILFTLIQILAVTMTIFGLVVLTTLGSWSMATRVFVFEGPTGPVEIDFTYVERDVYGRGTAIEIGEEQEAFSSLRRGQ